MANNKSNNGCLFELIKWGFILAFWPISLTLYIISYLIKEKERQKAEEQFQRQLELKNAEMIKKSEMSLRNHYTRQLNESIRIIQDTKNIATLFSRLSFLEQLKSNVINYGEGDLTDVIKNIDVHLEKREEYINLFILRRVYALEIECETSTNTAKKKRFTTLFFKFEEYKSQMSNENVETYTALCHKHMDDEHNVPKILE